MQAQATWTRLALGQGPSERAFAVILGYAVVGLLLSLYLNLLTVGNAKTAGRAVRSAVRQQLLVLKVRITVEILLQSFQRLSITQVAAFIFIELVTFPLGCGVVLDLCTVWLFPEADLMSRAAFFFRAPLTAMFYHWVAGTMFMSVFSLQSSRPFPHTMLYTGIPLPSYYLAVAVLCAPGPCGSLKTPRTKIRIPFGTFLTAQH